jgi:hypothetical protein
MRLSTATITLSALLAGVIGLPAVAQTTGTAPRQASSSEAAPPPGESVTPQQEESEGGQSTAPVLWVSSVEDLRSSHGPELDVIRVRGLSSNEGWEGAELIPLTKGTPPDGVLDLAFVAQAPSNSTAPSKFQPVEAVFVVEPGHPYKGVRVHGATNRVTLRSMPGFAESPAPPRDCENCTGKYFVGKGQAAPANIKPSDTVREEDLPKTVRVLKSGEGLGKFDSDPNRLTLILDDNGQIVLAVWD